MPCTVLDTENLASGKCLIKDGRYLHCSHCCYHSASQIGVPELRGWTQDPEMSPKSHHGHSKQGDTPGVRSRHGHFWKESSPEIQRVPPFWILPFRSLLTIPSRSTPLGPALPNHTLRINPTPCAPWCHSFLPLWSQLRGPRGVFQLRAMLVGLEATGPDSSCDAGPGPGKPQAEAPGRGTRLRPVPGLAVAGCQHRLPWLRAKGLQTVQAQNKKFHFVSGKIYGQAGCKGIPA